MNRCMVLLLGQRTGVLTAIAEEIAALRTVVISPESPEVVAEQLGRTNAAPGLILLDIHQPFASLEQSIRDLKRSFPETPLWAFFESDSPALQRTLATWGIEKILPYSAHLRHHLPPCA